VVDPQRFVGHAADLQNDEARSGVPDAELYQVFNMGVGMVSIVSADKADAVLKFIRAHKHKAWLIGRSCQRQGRSAGGVVSGLWPDFEPQARRYTISVAHPVRFTLAAENPVNADGVGNHQRHANTRNDEHDAERFRRRRRRCKSSGCSPDWAGCTRGPDTC